RLGGLETARHDLFGGSCLSAVHQVPGVLGRFCFDHGDGDIAGVSDSAGDDHVERGIRELIDVREADPAVTDQCDAYAAYGSGKWQPGHLGGQRGRVDGDHVAQLVRIQRHDYDDDLDLVAQALDEARPERAVNQAAGEDRTLGRAALATEE